jgi:hypothetical protein
MCQNIRCCAMFVAGMYIHVLHRLQIGMLLPRSMHDSDHKSPHMPKNAMKSLLCNFLSCVHHDLADWQIGLSGKMAVAMNARGASTHGTRLLCCL